jgi:hypothetical protein
MNERLHIVRQGEWLTIIAHQHGFATADDVYEHDVNKALRDKRKDPNCLYPGDEVWIPPCPYEAQLRPTHSGGGAYRIQVKAPGKEKLEIVLYDDDGQPVANKPFQLKIGAHTENDNTDGNGKLSVEFDTNLLGYGTYSLVVDGKEIPLGIGVLDPVDTMEGIQARLNNLGYNCGPVDGRLGKSTVQQIRRFQKAQSLAVDGIPGPNTRKKLDEEYKKTL